MLVTAPDAGAEAIPFVKMWLLFPISIVFIGSFSWIAHRISLRAAFTSIIAFFLVSYALFSFVCFPYREQLHLNHLANSLTAILPQGWGGLVAVVRYWSYSLFYVTAECWCTMVYSVVFWGYANDVTKFHEAKKYYPYLTLSGTIAALVSGPIAIFLSNGSAGAWIPFGHTPWEQSLYALTLLVLLCGVSALLIFLRLCPRAELKKTEVEEPKTSFLQSMRSVLQSRYLFLLASIGFTYNLVINLTDVIWKNEILKLYPDPGHFTAYLSGVTFMTGVISTLFTVFVCRQSLQRFGWTFTTMITPVIALVTGLFFFGSLYLNELDVWSISLSTITFLGSMHICLSCGGKYTLFEPAKEIAFIPLDSKQKLNGKVAIDGVGTRLGKTSSSLIYQLLLMNVPTITACTPFVALMIFGAILICMFCVNLLGKEIGSHSTEAVSA